MKKVKMDLLFSDPKNPMKLIGVFREAARAAGWSYEETEAVVSEALAGSYQHLVETLLKYIEEDYKRFEVKEDE